MRLRAKEKRRKREEKNVGSRSYEQLREGNGSNSVETRLNRVVGGGRVVSQR